MQPLQQHSSGEQMFTTSDCWSCLCPLPPFPASAGTRTFAFLGPEAAGGVGPSVVGRGKGRLLVALGMGDLTVDLVGQVPQQAHAILHQLGREPERLTETLGAALQVCE